MKKEVKIAVVYHSNAGHNLKMAESVAAGAASLDGVVSKIFDCTKDVDMQFLLDSDAIIFGCPTYMGSISAQMKMFFDSTSSVVFSNRQWVNKIAAGFTNSGSPSGDKLNTLMQINIFAMQHGMIWVGLDLTTSFKNSDDEKYYNRLGSWLGAMSQSRGDDDALESDALTGQYLGARVASIALKMKN